MWCLETLQRLNAEAESRERKGADSRRICCAIPGFEVTATVRFDRARLGDEDPIGKIGSGYIGER